MKPAHGKVATVTPIRPDVAIPSAVQARDEAAVAYAVALSLAEQLRDLEREAEREVERFMQRVRRAREAAEADVAARFKELHVAAQSVRPVVLDGDESS